jgi:hypothetical protein
MDLENLRFGQEKATRVLSNYEDREKVDSPGHGVSKGRRFDIHVPHKCVSVLSLRQPFNGLENVPSPLSPFQVSCGLPKDEQ